ncbi:unnamed protein product [Timema podura]|uniref:Major facilitator superfamily (MFS) profile domain-containing protein n=1 Tax=Timema podura TaxID=61482 RepID=A0ABN7P105_TIMPD|nr:unnamed protein product [Timema podura]
MVLVLIRSLAIFHVPVDLSGFAQGIAIGWPSPTLPLLQSHDTPLGGQPMTDEGTSWVGSLICLSALLATPVFSFMADKFSRKLTGYLVGVLIVIGWTLILFAQTEMTLHVARFIIGLGCGASLALCPLYVTEISEDSIRGTLGTVLIFLTNGGVLFSYIVGSYVPYHIFNYVCFSVPVLYLTTFFFMPESPVYLMNRGRIEDARKSLRWLRGGQVPEIEREITRITESIKNNGQDKNKISIMDLFSSRGTIKAMVIGILLMANVQLCGIFAVFSYTVNIFQLSGSNLSPNLSTILTGSFLFIGVLLATFLIDRAGRKVLMIISDLVMFLCMGVLGGYFYLKNTGADVENYGWVPVASLSLHVFSLSLGVGTVPYVVIAEIFQPQYRGLGMTLSICTLWLWAFLVSKFFTALCYTLGDHGCFWLFAVICLMGAVFIHFFVPETKNRSLQSILRELNGEDYDSIKLKCSNSYGNVIRSV